MMQVLLRNPLADPYILGVSGGASIAALGAMLLGLSGFWIDGGAALGAFAATVLVFALAHGEGGWTPMRLLLTGVVVAAGLRRDSQSHARARSRKPPARHGVLVDG